MALSRLLAVLTVGLAAVLTTPFAAHKLGVVNLQAPQPGTIAWAAFMPMLNIVWLAFYYLVIASIIAGGIEMATGRVAPILQWLGVPLPRAARPASAFSAIFTAVIAYLIVQNILAYGFGCTAGPGGISCPVAFIRLQLTSPFDLSNPVTWLGMGIVSGVALAYVIAYIRSFGTREVVI